MIIRMAIHPKFTHCQALWEYRGGGADWCSLSLASITPFVLFRIDPLYNRRRRA